MIRLRDLVPFFFIVRTFLIKIGIIICGLVSILWISGGIYGSFYYSCLPHQTYSMPIYFTFQPCPLEAEQPRCSWISAKIDFQDEELVLEPEEKYTLRLELNLPSDEINRNAGMFMVCLNLKPLEAEVIQKCKSSILPHRTSVSRVLRSLFPFQNYGGEESLSIEFFSQMQRSENAAPIAEAEIVVQSKSVGISDASFHVHAHFTGISHFMYHYPISSGIAGITIIRFQNNVNPQRKQFIIGFVQFVLFSPTFSFISRGNQHLFGQKGRSRWKMKSQLSWRVTRRG